MSSLLPEVEQALTGAIAHSSRRGMARRGMARHGRRWTARTIALAVAVCATTAVALAATVWGPLAPEAHRPLPVLGSGRTETLAGYRGKPLVVTFYASWCSPCRQQARMIDKVARELRAKGTGNAILIGIKDQDAAARRFVAQYGLHLTILQDPKGTVAKAYKVVAVPWTFVIDANGRQVSDHAGLVTRKALDQAIAQATNTR